MDVLKWLYDEGSKEKVYSKLDNIIKGYGPDFLYVETDDVISSIINKIDPLDTHNFLWNTVTINLVDRKTDKWKLTFSDNFTDESVDVFIELDLEYLGVTDGKKYLNDFIYRIT